MLGLYGWKRFSSFREDTKWDWVFYGTLVLVGVLWYSIISGLLDIKGQSYFNRTKEICTVKNFYTGHVYHVHRFISYQKDVVKFETIDGHVIKFIGGKSQEEID